MKKLLLLAAALPSSVLLAQTPQTVSIGAGYTEQVWYSLMNGVQQTRPANEWDLAFEITGFTASILANTQKAGLAVYQAPYSVAQWSTLDTAGILGWPVLQNADTSWSYGAFNQGPVNGEFDLGWGDYNSITHVVTGDSLYVIELANGSWRKLRIDNLSGGAYNFTHANVDGTDVQTGQLMKSAFTGKNFGYYSLETNAAIDREPLSADWDLTFCRYITFIPQPYAVTGVLHNKNVTTARVAGLPPAQAVHDGAVFQPEINTIGYDWKSFNMTTFQYEIDDSLTYFVQDIPGNIWKVVFTGFGGSATGDMDFTKELVSPAGIVENVAAPQVVVYPNPVSDGHANLIMVLSAPNTTLMVSDITGKQVKEERIGTVAGLIQYDLDVSDLTPGMYLVNVRTTSGASATSRLVVR